MNRGGSRREYEREGRPAWPWAALWALALSGCGRPDPAQRPQAPDKILAFDVLFAQNCAGCHGAEGRMGPAPPLNDPLFLAIIPDAELKRVIREGRKGTLMPAFAKAHQGRLTDEQIDGLAKGLREHWGKEPDRYKGTPPYRLAAAPTGRKEAGKKVYAEACAMCHGDHGEGGDAGALNDPAFLDLVSNQLLRRIAITGRPDLGMPDYKTRDDPPLTSRQIADVVAYVASWRKVLTK